MKIAKRTGVLFRDRLEISFHQLYGGMITSSLMRHSHIAALCSIWPPLHYETAVKLYERLKYENTPA